MVMGRPRGEDYTTAGVSLHLLEEAQMFLCRRMGRVLNRRQTMDHALEIMLKMYELDDVDEASQWRLAPPK